MMQASLAERLRVLRAQRGLTLVEAAEEIGIGRDTLSDLERGRRHPVMPTLAKIAEGYGVPVEELLEEPVAGPLDEAPKTEGPSAEDSTELRRSPLEPIVTAADILVRGAADPDLERDKAFGLMLAAQALEDQLSVFMGDLEAWGHLSGHDRFAVARLMGRLDGVIESYNTRMEGEMRFTQIEHEEAQNARPEELIEKWK